LGSLKECAKYLEQVKEQFGLRSDYALATCLGITQPEANLIRRGRKTPNPELCVRIAKLLGLNPVEVLLMAQKDKSSNLIKPHWDMALTAVDVMSQVPKRPRYLPHKVEAIGRELRQLTNQMLCYEGALAHVEAVRLMEATQRSVDSVMERWQLWKKRGEFLSQLFARQSRGRSTGYRGTASSDLDETRHERKPNHRRECASHAGPKTCGRGRILCLTARVGSIRVLSTVGEILQDLRGN